MLRIFTARWMSTEREKAEDLRKGEELRKAEDRRTEVAAFKARQREHNMTDQLKIIEARAACRPGIAVPGRFPHLHTVAIPTVTSRKPR
jgi:hypothetical protein